MQEKQKERLTEEQRSLVEENIGLAKRIAWKYQTTCAQYGMEWDDVFSIACLGLMRAARSFDPSKSRAATYLTYGCETEVLQELRRQRAESRSAFATVSLQEVCGRDRQGHELRLEDTLPSDVPGTEEAALSACMETKIQAMLERKTTPMQKRVLMLRMSGLSQKEVAQKIGCSQTHVSRILSKIRRRVMEELAS